LNKNTKCRSINVCHKQRTWEINGAFQGVARLTENRNEQLWLPLYSCEACAGRLCSHTLSVGLNPETSIDDSAKESSHFHMHGSHFWLSLAWSFPFSLLLPFLLACSGRASVTATAGCLALMLRYIINVGLFTVKSQTAHFWKQPIKINLRGDLCPANFVVSRKIVNIWSKHVIHTKTWPTEKCILTLKPSKLATGLSSMQALCTQQNLYHTLISPGTAPWPVQILQETGQLTFRRFSFWQNVLFINLRHKTEISLHSDGKKRAKLTILVYWPNMFSENLSKAECNQSQYS